jgi:hypothetical protein
MKPLCFYIFCSDREQDVAGFQVGYLLHGGLPSNNERTVI